MDKWFSFPNTRQKNTKWRKTKQRESKMGHLNFKRPSLKQKRQDKAYTNNKISTSIKVTRRSARVEKWMEIDWKHTHAHTIAKTKQNKNETKLIWSEWHSGTIFAISKYTLVTLCRTFPIVFRFIFHRLLGQSVYCVFACFISILMRPNNTEILIVNLNVWKRSDRKAIFVLSSMTSGGKESMFTLVCNMSHCPQLLFPLLRANLWPHYWYQFVRHVHQNW